MRLPLSPTLRAISGASGIDTPWPDAVEVALARTDDRRGVVVMRDLTTRPLIADRYVMQALGLV